MLGAQMMSRPMLLQQRQTDIAAGVHSLSHWCVACLGSRPEQIVFTLIWGLARKILAQTVALARRPLRIYAERGGGGGGLTA